MKLSIKYTPGQETPELPWQLLWKTGYKLPWVHTPLYEGKSLSESSGCTVLMKLDLHQPSGSFKSRGVGNFILSAVRNSKKLSLPLPHIYISSGGNAGLAAVVAAVQLGCKCTVVVPESTTQLMIGKIRKAGGEVIQKGESWAEADEFLRGIMKAEEEQGRGGGVYCPPFDHEDIWEGNSSIIDELLQDIDKPPAAIIASVGGGGLFAGLQLGLIRNGFSHVPLIAVETRGADSLSQSLIAGIHTTLPAITSIATSLGARRVAEKAYELGQSPNVRSVVVEDAQAAKACVQFAEEERGIVEAACGASLAVCYEGIIRKILPELKQEDKVVVIVCGGSNISLEMLDTYRKRYGESNGDGTAA